MMIQTAYKFRIFPTKKQTTLLSAQLEICRKTYNFCLNYSITNHGKTDEYLKRSDLYSGIKEVTQTWKELGSVHSQVLQNVADRVDKAFKNYKRRVREKVEEPGFPRFKAHTRYSSFCFPQSGFKFDSDNKLKLSKIGHIKVKKHREIEGKIKTCTISVRNNKWFAIFTVESEPKARPMTGKQVGLDLGLKTYAMFSNTKTISNPKFFRVEQKNLAKSQRKLEKFAKQTKEREKQKKVISRIHERISNKRDNFCHQESNKIVNNYDFIVLEDLKIKNMLRNRKLSKSISDASWNIFSNFIQYKAENAGKRIIFVNPKNTSQICCKCHKKSEIKLVLKDRVFDCKFCDNKMDRDSNSSINILGLGIQTLEKS